MIYKIITKLFKNNKKITESNNSNIIKITHIVTALVWSIKCLKEGVPNKIELEEFKKYNCQHKTFMAELEHLSLKTMEFIEKWQVNTIIYKTKKSINIKECIQEALEILENIEETLMFHSDIQDKFNLGTINIYSELPTTIKEEKITITATLEKCLISARNLIKNA